MNNLNPHCAIWPGLYIAMHVIVIIMHINVEGYDGHEYRMGHCVLSMTTEAIPRICISRHLSVIS